MFWCGVPFFYYSNKMDQGNCIKFWEKKNEIRCARTFKMLTVAVWRAYYEQNTCSIVV